MTPIGKYSLQVEKNRSYIAAIRALLGIGQYYVVRHMNDDRIIRESEISVIDGKIGKKHLWGAYAAYMRILIADSGHSNIVKDTMLTLLREWEEA